MVMSSSRSERTSLWIPSVGDCFSKVLPPLLHVGGSSSEAMAMRWLLDQLVKEVVADQPGAILASNQLAQLLCIQ